MTNLILTPAERHRRRADVYAEAVRRMLRRVDELEECPFCDCYINHHSPGVHVPTTHADDCEYALADRALAGDT